jgi:hypothetical protein
MTNGGPRSAVLFCHAHLLFFFFFTAGFFLAGFLPAFFFVFAPFFFAAFFLAAARGFFEARFAFGAAGIGAAAARFASISSRCAIS